MTHPPGRVRSQPVTLRYIPGHSPLDRLRRKVRRVFRGPAQRGPLSDAQRFLRDLPVLHQRPGMEPHSGGLNPVIGQSIIDEVERIGTPRVIETGSGASSVLFLMLGCSQVTAINPDPAIAGLIEQDALDRGLDTSPLRCIAKRSELVLPQLFDAGEKYDVALIDGNHGWPSVWIDFFYMNAMMGAGSVVFVDDIQIYACDQLVRLLEHQPGFERIPVAGKMATFRKHTDDRFLPDWVDEPFIVERTHPRYRSRRAKAPAPKPTPARQA